MCSRNGDIGGDMQNILNESDLNVNSNELVVIAYTSKWCTFCPKAHTIYKKMEEEFKTVKFYSIDIDLVSSLAAKYRIMSLPTLVFLKNGIETNRAVGLVLTDSLRKTFKSFVGSNDK